jgi:hypothetical protein
MDIPMFPMPVVLQISTFYHNFPTRKRKKKRKKEKKKGNPKHHHLGPTNIRNMHPPPQLERKKEKQKSRNAIETKTTIEKLKRHLACNWQLNLYVLVAVVVVFQGFPLTGPECLNGMAHSILHLIDPTAPFGCALRHLFLHKIKVLYTTRYSSSVPGTPSTYSRVSDRPSWN